MENENNVVDLELKRSSKLKKYIFMYNIDGDSLDQEMYENKLSKAGIDYYIDEESIFKNKKVKDEGNSLWVLEEHYIVAFTILTYEELLKIHWYDYEGSDVQDVLDWYDRHKDNELFVCCKEVK